MLYFRGGMKGTSIVPSLVKVYRPLFFEFPEDSIAYNDDVLDTQILIGKELMSAPIVEKGVVIRKAHFPTDTWYDFLTGLLLQKLSDQPRYHMVYSPLDDFVPLFIRKILLHILRWWFHCIDLGCTNCVDYTRSRLKVQSDHCSRHG